MYVGKVYPFPSEFPEGRLSFLQRFARDVCWEGENCPYGEREGEEKERAVASVKIMSERMVLTNPHSKYTQDLPTGVSGQ
jgi:hypothetical protein